MGYYTETKFDFHLKKNTPKEIVELLDRIFHDGRNLYNELFGSEVIPKDNVALLSVDETPNLPIEHCFGKCKRWDQFLHGTFNKEELHIIIDSDIKMYDSEAYKFVDWLSDYIVEDMVGTTRGEDQEHNLIVPSNFSSFQKRLWLE